jgi:hypothetical protein
MYLFHSRNEEILSLKPEVNRQLGRPRRRREDNIKMNNKEVGW